VASTDEATASSRPREANDLALLLEVTTTLALVLALVMLELACAAETSNCGAAVVGITLVASAVASTVWFRPCTTDDALAALSCSSSAITAVTYALDVASDESTNTAYASIATRLVPSPVLVATPCDAATIDDVVFAASAHTAITSVAGHEPTATATPSQTSQYVLMAGSLR
jgi:hypothetical protein